MYSFQNTFRFRNRTHIIRFVKSSIISFFLKSGRFVSVSCPNLTFKKWYRRFLKIILSRRNSRHRGETGSCPSASSTLAIHDKTKAPLSDTPSPDSRCQPPRLINSCSCWGKQHQWVSQDFTHHPRHLASASRVDNEVLNLCGRSNFSTS